MMNGASRKRLLVVDDDQGVVDYLLEMLEDEGYLVQGVTSARDALDRATQNDFDLIISDVEMPGMRGIDLLTAIRARKPHQLLLLITAFGSVDMATQAVRAGACDFITKPFRIEVLLHAIERVFRERQMQNEIIRLRTSLRGSPPGDLVARSPAMIRIVELARRTARTDTTALITGESGTGKGCIARFIHDQSPRAKGPFVQVNCAALPAPLVESELFGVRRGAFTDAREHRPGLFLEAHGGTLFLDEIAEMPLEIQPKLLQVLETHKVRPVGGSGETEVNARVIAATNRSLEEALRERRFRPDLYYRLNVIRIDIPALCERQEDVEALIDVHLQRAATRLGHPIVGIAPEALRWLLAYHWPGNVRELANVIERAVALADSDIIQLEDLTMASSNTSAPNFLNDALARNLSLADVERTYIKMVLEATGGNKVQAARILGIDRRTLYRKAEEEEPETL